MVRHRFRFVLATMLAGCQAGVSNGVPAAPTAEPPGVTSVQFSVHVGVPQTSATHSVRHQYVSPSTSAVRVDVYAASDTAHAHVLTSLSVDVSPGSTSCAGSALPSRVCTASAPMPAGDDAFAFTTFDRAPVNGAIPSGANVLGTGAATQKIAAGQQNVVNVYVSSRIAGISTQTTFASLPADGVAHAFAFVIQPTDFDNNPISAGTSDPYANPISATLAESNATGHAHLVLNGSAAGNAATLTHSSDALSLAYDGGGNDGYSAVVTFAASGAASQTVRISPLFAQSTSPYWSNGSVGFSGAGETATVSLSEAGAPAAVTYSVTGTGCNGIATAGAVSGNGTAASVVLTSGSGSGTSCSFGFSDSLGSTIRANVALSATGTPLTIGGHTFTSFALPSVPNGITAGPDGNLWATTGSGVSRISTAGLVANFPAPPGPAPKLEDIVTGPDGRLWAPDENSARTFAIALNGSYTSYVLAAAGYGVSAGPDGNLWITTSDASGQCKIDVLTIAGYSFAFPCAAGSLPWGISPAPDGRMWFVEPGSQAVARMSADGSYSQFYLPAGDAGIGMTLGADGNLWVAEGSNAMVSQIATSGIVNDYALPAGAQPKKIVSGPDGALWFTDPGTGAIGRVTTAGIATETAIPIAAALPSDIACGPDGNLWFTVPNLKLVVRMTP